LREDEGPVEPDDGAVVVGGGVVVDGGGVVDDVEVVVPADLVFHIWFDPPWHA